MLLQEGKLFVPSTATCELQIAGFPFEVWAACHAGIGSCSPTTAFALISPLSGSVRISAKDVLNASEECPCCGSDGTECIFGNRKQDSKGFIEANAIHCTTPGGLKHGKRCKIAVRRTRW